MLIIELEKLVKDIRFGMRSLTRSPAFALTAVLSLALGIGACAAIFTIVDAVLVRPLPYPDSERIVQINEVSEKGSLMRFAEPNYLDIRTRNRSLEALAQYSSRIATITGGSQPVRARTVWATSEFFNVLGVQPFAGRFFSPEVSGPNAEPIAVVSHGFWQRVLGGAGDLSTVTLKIGDQVYSVVGVMPAGFSFPNDAEVWLPRELLPAETSRTAHNWAVIARLNSEISLEGARADVSGIGKQLKQEHGQDIDAVDMAVTPLQEFLVGGVRQVLLVVCAAVGFLMLVASTNVANLLLGQVTARHKELAVRTALGASRLRLARQLITENALLTLLGGSLGVGLSIVGVKFLINLNRHALPRADEIGVDVRALVFALGVSLLIAVVLGLVPLVRFSDQQLQTDLKEAGRGQSETRSSKRLRGFLVVSQVAFTVVLLVGAGLLAKSFVRLLEVDPGFRVDSTVVMDVSLPASPRKEEELKQLMLFFARLREGQGPLPEPTVGEDRLRRQLLFHQQLDERITRIPGVLAMGAINSLPMTGGAGNGTFWIENNVAATGYAEYRQATSGYFAAMGIPLLQGRLFEPTDSVESPPVAVISKSLAQKVWPNQDPIGRRIQFGNMDGDLRLLQIVGIVGDVREHGLNAEAEATVYANALQRPGGSNLSFVVRAQTDSGALIPAMRQALHELDATLPSNFRTVSQIYSASLDRPRFSLVIFGVFAAVALTLAAMGIYGVVSYSVSRRTSEIGIRMAMGARAIDVMRLVMGQGLKLVLVGMAVGSIGALLLSRLMETMLFGVSSRDLAVFLVTPLTVVVVAILAAYIPGRRAAKLDPMAALRTE